MNRSDDEQMRKRSKALRKVVWEGLAAERELLPSLIIGGKLETLTHFVEKNLKALRQSVASHAKGGSAAHFRALRRRLRRAREATLHDMDVGHDHALHGQHSSLAERNALLKFGDPCGQVSGHPEIPVHPAPASPAADGAEPIAPASHVHRLSEGEK